jgi:hypothetical protein
MCGEGIERMSQSCCKRKREHLLACGVFLPLPLGEGRGEGLSEKIFEMVLSWAKTTVLERPRHDKLRSHPKTHPKGGE